MITLLSPAKGQDFSSAAPTDHHSLPAFLDQTATLITKLRGLTKDELSKLMAISPALTQLNWQRYQDFNCKFNLTNAKQAIFAFTGDVYQQLACDHYDRHDLDFAQHHLRILSGLYGCLRPLDLIQPYRLEMKTKLSTDQGNNLYQFWQNKIANHLTDLLSADPHPVIINLASNEYFQCIKPHYHGRLITIVFMEKKHGKNRVIAIHAKRARGMMTNFIIKNKINNPDKLQKFNQGGYIFNLEISNHERWIFSRLQP